MLFLSVLFESCDSTALILFVLKSLSERLSIQYVYERVFLFVSPVSQSGCKTKTSFCFLQEKLEKILKLFFRLFFSISLSVPQWTFPCFAGCKCKKHFSISQAFQNLFFENFFSPDPKFLPVFRWTPFAVAGAKVEPLFTFARLFFIFFPSFFRLFLNFLITAHLQRKLFYAIVGFFFY